MLVKPHCTQTVLFFPQLPFSLLCSLHVASYNIVCQCPDYFATQDIYFLEFKHLSKYSACCVRKGWLSVYLSVILVFSSQWPNNVCNYYPHPLKKTNLFSCLWKFFPFLGDKKIMPYKGDDILVHTYLSSIHFHCFK